MMGDGISNRLDVMSSRMDMMKGEMRHEMGEAMGRELLVVRHEVRECVHGVWEEGEGDRCQADGGDGEHKG